MKGLALELGRHRIRGEHRAPHTVNTDIGAQRRTYELFLPGNDNPTREQFARIAQRLNVLPEPWAEPPT